MKNVIWNWLAFCITTMFVTLPRPAVASATDPLNLSSIVTDVEDSVATIYGAAGTDHYVVEYRLLGNQPSVRIHKNNVQTAYLVVDAQNATLSGTLMGESAVFAQDSAAEQLPATVDAHTFWLLEKNYHQLIVSPGRPTPSGVTSQQVIEAFDWEGAEHLGLPDDQYRDDPDSDGRITHHESNEGFPPESNPQCMPEYSECTCDNGGHHHCHCATAICVPSTVPELVIVQLPDGSTASGTVIRTICLTLCSG